ncbi:Putative Paxillin [[Torrubiella] hemipterigena]|uniref:Putative Paxillin n=1 Tax=[Torrubiella] hemipterigena TaxID=1531966 RepID=A0A0A1TPE8_9HYPO|nr:Putative Paxillin [[Torrubiella] hemipterigena]
MSNDQMANYLSDLRTNRTPRPGGIKPTPSPAPSATYSVEPPRSLAGRYSIDQLPRQAIPEPRREPSFAPSYAASSVASRYSTAGSMRGRDYYQAAPSAPTGSMNPNEVVPTATYMERGQRWMEKEEVVSLRDAMDQMHIRSRPSPAPSPAIDEEQRVYNAALDEAAELVWQHQNGRMEPERPDGAYRYRPHLRKNSYAYARAASIGDHGEDIIPTGMNRDIGYRSVSNGSQGSDGYRRDSSSTRPSGEYYSVPNDTVGSRRKTYGGVANQSYGRRSSRRNISGEVVDVPFSGDQIWNEPGSPGSQVAPVPAIATHLVDRHSVVNQPAMHPPPSKPLNRVEIHRNPPSRSRNAQYTTNAASGPPAPDPRVETRNGIEKRSQDIRDATSMRKSDRSARLPEPTAVSDRPGRPISPRRRRSISVDPSSSNTKHHRRSGVFKSLPSLIPTIAIGNDDDDAAAPGIPAINIPSIAVDEPSSTAPEVPSISVSVDEPKEKVSGSRPLPAAGRQRSKPRAPFQPRGHISLGPAIPGRARTLCHECGFPIDGRFVSLAGISERFHPACFSCYCCGTSLEAMEISPEPDTVRLARVERIRRREAGEDVPDEPGATEADDGDERLRFYCHLDWHESFAPRCKHCKTPILGEHVVALGEHWHNGHFFCAECGDPFSHGMTHIEKDGYAWCINCQTKRTERRAPKCRACKTAVIGQYIEALGAEWHDHCFRCADCSGGFADGQIFVREGGSGVVVCTACRAKELKL